MRRDPLLPVWFHVVAAVLGLIAFAFVAWAT